MQVITHEWFQQKLFMNEYYYGYYYFVVFF